MTWLSKDYDADWSWLIYCRDNGIDSVRYTLMTPIAKDRLEAKELREKHPRAYAVWVARYRLGLEHHDDDT